MSDTPSGLEAPYELVSVVTNKAFETYSAEHASWDIFWDISRACDRLQ
jgi:hypothetical protein